MNSEDRKDDKREWSRDRSKHLDQFPKDRDLAAWEQAVLERARKRGFYRHHRKYGEQKLRDDLFWERLGAYEAGEISKRRQNRKKSPTRYERYETLEEERHDRNVRHGISADDALYGAERKKRRAERFGLTQVATQVVPKTGKERVPIKGGVFDKMRRQKSLLEHAENVEKLEKRRRRFAMEPREDSFYEPRWVSEIVGDELQDREKEERVSRRGRGKGRRGRRRRQESGRRDSPADGRALERTSAEDVLMSENLGDQEWGSKGESWGPADGGGRDTPPDDVVVSSVRATGDGPASQRDADQRSGADGGGMELQSWEARGETW